MILTIAKAPARRWLVYGSLPVLLLCAQSGCDGTGRGRSSPAQENPQRIVVTARWDTLARIGSTDPNDTTLLHPSAAPLLLWDDKLVVSDGPNQTVRVFSVTGTLLWSIHRPGGGPGEIGQLGPLAISPQGTLWIVDNRNRKRLEFAASGGLLGELTLQHLPASPDALVVRPNEVVLFTQSADSALLVVEPDSFALRSTAPLPWPDSLSSDLNLRLVTATPAATSDADWVAAFAFGPGFLVARGDSVYHYPFIESVPYALKSSPAVRAAGADSARYGARAAAIVNDEVLFLFGGRPRRNVHPAEPTVLIDAYGLDGEYRRSYVLPGDTRSIAAFGESLFVSTWIEGTYPVILRLRPRPE